MNEKLHQILHIASPELYQAAQSRGVIYVWLEKNGKPIKWADPKPIRVWLTEGKNSLHVRGENASWVASKRGRHSGEEVVYATVPNGQPFMRKPSSSSAGYYFKRDTVLIDHVQDIATASIDGWL